MKVLRSHVKDSNRLGVAGRVCCVLASLVLAGCSLLTIKSPEIPLTPREQEARLLTRDFAAHFATSVTQLIDEATPPDSPAIRSQALRLKLGAVTAITRTSTHDRREPGRESARYLGVCATVS
jgi:hypothetical protein